MAHVYHPAGPLLTIRFQWRTVDDGIMEADRHWYHLPRLGEGVVLTGMPVPMTVFEVVWCDKYAHDEPDVLVQLG